MPRIASIQSSSQVQEARAEQVLLRRAVPTNWVLHLDCGRVALGLLVDDKLEHQFGVVEGPSWIEATAAVLNLPSAVDAVAQTEVRVRRVPLTEFRRALTELPRAAQGVLHDVALGARQQTELAVSRLSKDAESRCAEWLVRHAQTGPAGEMIVPLQQRKRLIAAQLGIAPETFSRVLHHLRDRGLVAGAGRTLTLPHPGDLRALAGA